MKEQIKNKLLFVFKYLIGLILLGWILARVDRTQMILTLTNISLPVLGAILSVAVLNLLSQFLRWRFLVDNHSNHYNKKDLIPSFFAGFAFRLIIPGGHAEITKVFLLPGRKRGKVVAFGIEKFFQTYIKFILILIALPPVFPEYQISLWSLAGIGIVAYFFFPLIFRLSIMKQFQEKKINYNLIFIRTLLYSLAIFGCLILQYFILLNEFHNIGIWGTVLTVIFIWGAGLLPISVSGLGVRENLAVFFLARFGIPDYVAVGTALFIFFINSIIPAIIGLIYNIRRRKDLHDAKGTIKTVTKSIFESGKQKINGKQSKSKKPQEDQPPAEDE